MLDFTVVLAEFSLFLSKNLNHPLKETKKKMSDDDSVVDLEATEDVENNSNNIRSVRYIVSANQLHSITLNDLNLPPELCEGFFGINTYNQRLTTPSDTLLASYCPLLIGPCCTPLRRHDVCRMLKTFTFWLIICQVAVYIFCLSQTKNPFHNTIIDTNILIEYGCISPQHIKEKYQYWRCLSTILLHGSFSHVSINVFIEFFFVLGREANWNSLRLIGVYLLSSFCGAFFTLDLSPGFCSTGASCGIFGVFGSFIALYFILFENLQWRYRIGTLFMVTIILLFLIVAGSQEGIDFNGHLGGFLFGLFMGLALFAYKCPTHKKRVIVTLLGIIVCIILMFGPLILFIFDIRFFNLFTKHATSKFVNLNEQKVLF